MAQIEKCGVCNGKGYIRCPICEGKGKIWKQATPFTTNVFQLNENMEDCQTCQGTGKRLCKACDGAGKLLLEKSNPTGFRSPF